MTFNLAQAVGNIVISGRDLLRVTGIGKRLLDFDRAMCTIAERVAHAQRENSTHGDSWHGLQGVGSSSSMLDALAVTHHGGGLNVILRVTDLEISLPNGEVLVPRLSVAISQGRNLMVVGPNGCGKSSLLRLLGGLWRVRRGKLDWGTPLTSVMSATSGVLSRTESQGLPVDGSDLDEDGDSVSTGKGRSRSSSRAPFYRPSVMFLSQRAYMPLGSLEELIYYPLSKDQVLAMRCISEDALHTQLLELLSVTSLSHLLDAGLQPASDVDVASDCDSESDTVGHARTWTSIEEWNDVLSGGEKQRLCMARLFFHRPVLAVLDECTSAVSSDVEHQLYAHCERLDITVMSVSHKRSLVGFHSEFLRFTGDGSYEVGVITNPDTFHV